MRRHRHQHHWRTLAANYQPGQSLTRAKNVGMEEMQFLLYGMTTVTQQCTGDEACGLQRSFTVAGDARIKMAEPQPRETT